MKKRGSALLETHPLPLGLAAGTVSATAASLSSSSFSYPKKIWPEEEVTGTESPAFQGLPR